MSFIGAKPSQTLATPTSQYFNGTGSQTVFTLNRAVNVAEDLEVFVNNIQQEPGVGKSYTAVGTTLTFDAAPSSGTANVYVVYRGLAEVTTRLEHDANSALAATTGTFSGAFTSPGIDDNATSTAMTLDASGNVLVSKTAAGSGTAGIQLESGGRGGFTKNGAYVTFQNRLSSDGEISRFMKDGTTVGVIGSYAGVYTNIGTSNVGLMFNTGATAVIPHNMSTNTPSDNTINLGQAGYRWKDLYLSGGVYLGGTAAANHLDDYEEGTFTPSYAYATNGTHSSVLSDAIGYYRKIGKVVHCSIFLRWNSFSKGTASGNALVTNLPFTSANLNRAIGSGGWQAYNYPADTSKQFTFVVETAVNYLSLVDVGNNTTNDQINDPDAGTEFKIFVTYFTDA